MNHRASKTSISCGAGFFKFIDHMFQQTTGLKALSSVAIFKKIEDHFKQNQPDRLRENSRQKLVDKNWPSMTTLTHLLESVK